MWKNMDLGGPTGGSPLDPLSSEWPGRGPQGYCKRICSGLSRTNICWRPPQPGEGEILGLLTVAVLTESAISTLRIFTDSFGYLINTFSSPARHAPFIWSGLLCSTLARKKHRKHSGNNWWCFVSTVSLLHESPLCVCVCVRVCEGDLHTCEHIAFSCIAL